MYGRFSILWGSLWLTISIVVYLLLVLASIIEVGSPEQEPVRLSCSGEIRFRYQPGY